MRTRHVLADRCGERLMIDPVPDAIITQSALTSGAADPTHWFPILKDRIWGARLPVLGRRRGRDKCRVPRQ
jgi:hypothetical protein